MVNESEQMLEKVGFNGGKMEHIFVIGTVTTDDAKNYDEMPKQETTTKGNQRPKKKQYNKPRKASNRYLNEFHSGEAQEALEGSQHMYWKIDGACGMLRYRPADGDASLQPYERIDTRGKPPPEDDVPWVELPSIGISNNASQYQSHSYYFRPVVIDPEKDGKKQRQLKQAMLQVVHDNAAALQARTLSQHRTSSGEETNDDSNDPTYWCSIEWVGQKFQKTPGVTQNVGLVVHSEQRIDDAEGLPRTFAQTHDFLQSRAVEGLVLQHKGKFWKIRSNLILSQDDCKFESDKSKVPPPFNVYVAGTERG